MEFQGTSPIVVPTDAVVDVERDTDGILVHYISPSEGIAYLTFDFGTDQWSGVLGKSDGSVEFASADGSFSDFRAIGADDQPIRPDDYNPIPDEQVVFDTITPDPMDSQLSASLMSLNSIDHLVIA